MNLQKHDNFVYKRFMLTDYHYLWYSLFFIHLWRSDGIGSRSPPFLITVVDNSRLNVNLKLLGSSSRRRTVGWMAAIVLFRANLLELDAGGSLFPYTKRHVAHDHWGRILVPRTSVSFGRSAKRRVLVAAMTGCPKITDIQWDACVIFAFIFVHAQKPIPREGREV